MAIVGSSRKGRFKLPAPTAGNGNTGVSFVLWTGTFRTFSELGTTQPEGKCSSETCFNGPGYNLTRRLEGQLYKCASLLIFLKEESGSRMEPQLLIVSAFITLAYWHFLPPWLAPCSLTLPALSSLLQATLSGEANNRGQAVATQVISRSQLTPPSSPILRLQGITFLNISKWGWPRQTNKRSKLPLSPEA